jgi:hypothetical protein
MLIAKLQHFMSEAAKQRVLVISLQQTLYDGEFFFLFYSDLDRLADTRHGQSRHILSANYSFTASENVHRTFITYRPLHSRHHFLSR